MTRLYAAFEEVARAANPKAKVGQSALARKLRTSPQRVKNWESRGISQRGAQDAQLILGVNATWILYGTGPAFVGRPTLPTVSHLSTLDPDILFEALTLMVTDEWVAGRYAPRPYSDRLAELYGRIAADGGKLSEAHNREFMSEVEARAQGDGHGTKAVPGKRGTGGRTG